MRRRSARRLSTTVLLFSATVAFFFPNRLQAGPQEARPAYEAVLVKLDTSGSNNSSSDGSPGQVVMTNLTLRRVVERAYGLKPYLVTGPPWIETVRVDIVAKYPPQTKNEDRPRMLQTLLEDRFKLQAHRESRELPGYVLSVAKGGFKLKPVEPGPSHLNGTGSRIRTLAVKKVSMSALAEHLSRNQGETVVDKTGIDGVYDFELRWSEDDQTANSGEADAPPTLFVALQQTLGLRLQPQKVPVDVLVIDHIEPAPVDH